MRVARLFGVADMRLGEEPGPAHVPDGQSLIRTTSVGICGSDLHWFSDGGIGDASLVRPLVLGHEMAGIVEKGPLAGARVAIDPAQPCRACDACRRGSLNLCPTVRFAGHGEVDGGLREWLVWPDDLLHPVPDGVSDAGAAVLEPLGVALHAADLGKVRLGRSVAVVGCGPIGLLMIQVVRAAGASRVVAVEPLAHRRDAAVRLGAVDDPGAEVDIVLEAAGTNEAVETSMRLSRPGGRVVLAGIPSQDRTSFPAALARRKGLTILMARRMNEVYPRAIDLVRRGVVDVESLVTQRFPLAEAAVAFQVAAGRTGLKTVIDVSQ
jgi:L-iditol 2-dehydrogenase